MKLALTVAMVLIPIQILLGDQHGINTLEHQPAKLAAMEGIWEGGAGIPAVIFAIPNQQTRSNDYEISIPKLASLYLTHSWDGVVKGLNEFGDKIPPVAPVFFAFRIMVGMGVLMLLFSWLGCWQLRQNRPLPRLMAKGLVLMTFSGWVAVLAGWYVTEIGRQPYLVTGVLTTAQAATTLPTSMVFSTLFAYLTLYVGLLSAYIWVVFYLARQADDKENLSTQIEKKSETSWSPFRT
jgi:cytochrome d ubiquinol oxidase subunit I